MQLAEILALFVMKNDYRKSSSVNGFSPKTGPDLRSLHKNLLGIFPREKSPHSCPDIINNV